MKRKDFKRKRILIQKRGSSDSDDSRLLNQIMEVNQASTRSSFKQRQPLTQSLLSNSLPLTRTRLPESVIRHFTIQSRTSCSSSSAYWKQCKYSKASTSSTLAVSKIKSVSKPGTSSENANASVATNPNISRWIFVHPDLLTSFYTPKEVGTDLRNLISIIFQSLIIF